MPTHLETIVPVPLGAGVDRETDEFVLEAPKMRTAQNVTLKSRGALQKRAGWTTLNNGALGVGANTDILFRSRDTLAIFSDDRNQIYRNGSVDQLGRYQPTFSILSHPAFPANGTVHNVNVAHLSGYTAVVAAVHDNPTEMSAHNYQSATAVYAILDSEWNVVVGPLTSQLVGILPRVEPMLIGGDSYFVFTGLQDVTNNATNHWLGAASLQLNALRVSVGGSITTYSALDTVYPYQPGGAAVGDLCICYDTHGSGVAGDEVFFAYYDDGGSNLLTVGRLQNTGTYTTQTIAGTGTTPTSMAVHYDSASDTVLVFSEETDTLYYDDRTLPGFSSLAHPGTPPDSDLTSLTWPIFWRDGGSNLRLTDRPITITGSGPGTPSFGVAIAIGAMHAKPAPRGTDSAFFFSDFVDYSGSAGVFIGGGKAVEVISTNETNNAEFASVVAPLHGTRHTLEYKLGFFGRRNGSNGILGTVNQSAVTADGHVLRGDAIVTSGYLPRIRNRSKVVGAALELETGHGALSESLGIVVTEIDPTSTEYSFQNHFGSAILANGGLSTFDGEQVCPLSVRVLSVATSTTASNWATDPANPAWSVADNTEWVVPTTLSYVDKNNVRHRWPLDSTSGQNTSGAPAGVPAPNLLLGLPSEVEHLAQQGKLTVEFWGAEENVIGSTPNTDYILLSRAPVVFDGANWVADPGTLLDPTSVTNPTPYPYTTEALPAQVPACNVVKKVGNYVFAVASEAPTELWVSKPFGNYQAPEFPAEFMLTSPAEAGEIRSLAATGDHLILLCENGVWELFVGGGGPDANGDGAFPAFSLVYEGSGALNHRGTVSGDWGTLYMSADGPKLIRGSEVLHVGEQVKGLHTPAAVRATVFDETEREVWLFFEGGDALVFDVDLLAWTTATVRASAAIATPTNLLRLDNGGRLCERDETSTQDADGTYLLSSVTTPWFNLGSPLGFKRFHEVAALFRRIGGTLGGFTFELAVDYVDTSVVTSSFSGGLASLERGLQFLVRLNHQTTDAMRVTITETTEGVEEDDGEGGTVTVQRNDLRWSLAALSLAFVPKRGHITLQAEAQG